MRNLLKNLLYVIGVYQYLILATIILCAYTLEGAS